MKSTSFFSTFLILLVMASCGGNSNVPATINAEGNLNWLTIESLEQIPAADRKMVLVDVYTDWCGWCKKMDKTTFEDETVKQYLKDNFHVVKFNAEQKEAINFKGKTYNFVKNGKRGSNQLAAEMLNGRLGYPTIVYLDKDLNVMKASPGFKKPDQLISELELLKS